jgi:hypothetical protein
MAACARALRRFGSGLRLVTTFLKIPEDEPLRLAARRDVSYCEEEKPRLTMEEGKWLALNLSIA